MLLKEETLGSTLVRIARLAAELLPQADAATITISEAGGPTRTASSSEPEAPLKAPGQMPEAPLKAPGQMPEAPLKAPGKITVAELDAEQNHLDEGPCLAAMRDRQTVQLDSMHPETRWQGFCRGAPAAAIESG